jgi:adenylate cyclase class IV
VAIDCPDPRAAHRFLTAIGFAYVVDVVKIRTAYLHADGVGLSLDDYGSARVLELEIRSRSQSSQAALDYLRGWARGHLGDGLRELDEPHVLGVIRSALRAVGQGR